MGIIKRALDYCPHMYVRFAGAPEEPLADWLRGGGCVDEVKGDVRSTNECIWGEPSFVATVSP